MRWTSKAAMHVLDHKLQAGTLAEQAATWCISKPADITLTPFH